MRLTDYDRELAQINREISDLQRNAYSTRIDADTTTKFVYRLYHRASLSGKFADFEEAEAEIDKAISRIGFAQDLCLLKANLDFKFHRLGQTKRDLGLAPGLLQTFHGRALQADIAFQEGRYDDARGEYGLLISDERSWDNLARLAYLQSKMGDLGAAERLYIEAEDEITAKEMKSFAWVELQRGLLDLTHGHFDEAWDHYSRADRAYSGHWLIDEHIAELLGAQHRLEEAAALYEKVIERVPKPELQQALGDLYTLMGKQELAEPWYEKALDVYLESAGRGYVHYYHHLADFYSDVREDAGEALNWAHKDLELRNNFSTQAAFAWALYLDHQFQEALEVIGRALSSGVKEAGLFVQAGMIYKAAGRSSEGDGYLRLAAELNPQFHSFHVHH